MWPIVPLAACSAWMSKEREEGEMERGGGGRSKSAVMTRGRPRVAPSWSARRLGDEHAYGSNIELISYIKEQLSCLFPRGVSYLTN